MRASVFAQLEPLLWIAGVVFTYGVLARAFALLVFWGRKRVWGAAVLGPVVAVLHGAAVFQSPSAGRLAASALVSLAVLEAYCRLRVVARLDWRSVKSWREHLRQANLQLVLFTGAVIFSTPFFWLLSTSFKEDEDIFTFPPTLLPRVQKWQTIEGQRYPLLEPKEGGPLVAQVSEADEEISVRRFEGDRFTGPPETRLRADFRKYKVLGLKWKNYGDAVNFLPPETHRGLIYLWNTVFVALLNIAGYTLSSSLVAFAFARLRWPGRDTLFVVMLSTMMLPSAVTLIPVFLIFKGLGWIDTLRPLWVPAFFAAPFNVFLLRQFFLTIPNDLEDAAKIDGCSYFRIYWNIMLPLIKPALAALTIMAFLGSWNNFMGPLVYISSAEKMTLALALRIFQSGHSVEFGMLMAASTLVVLPVIVVFFFTQRYFIEGITLTGIKG